MEPILLFPDPVPPELAQALDLAGYPWKAASNVSIEEGCSQSSNRCVSDGRVSKQP